jgi:chemotaxis protein CheX
MAPLGTRGDEGFPAIIADAAVAALENTFVVICGEKPVRDLKGMHDSRGPCVAGIISFIGELTWSLTWMLPQEIAPVLASKFTGFDIAFESSDMGEAAAELVNVLAGDVVAQLEKRSIKSQMSLPTVARGDHLEFTPAHGPGVGYVHFSSTLGRFWFRLVAAKTGMLAGRRPGH